MKKFQVLFSCSLPLEICLKLLELQGTSARICKVKFVHFSAIVFHSRQSQKRFTEWIVIESQITGEEHTIYVKDGMPFFASHDVQDIFRIRVGDTMHIIKSKIADWNLVELEEIIRLGDCLSRSPILVSWRVTLLLALSLNSVHESVSVFLNFVGNLFEKMLSKQNQRQPFKCISNAKTDFAKPHIQTTVLLQKKDITT